MGWKSIGSRSFQKCTVTIRLWSEVIFKVHRSSNVTIRHSFLYQWDSWTTTGWTWMKNQFDKWARLTMSRRNLLKDGIYRNISLFISNSTAIFHTTYPLPQLRDRAKSLPVPKGRMPTAGSRFHCCFSINEMTQPMLPFICQENATVTIESKKHGYE